MNRKTLFVLLVIIILTIGGSYELNLSLKKPPTQKNVTYEAKVAFPNLSFEYPDGIYNSSDGINRLFVVGQMGYIYVFKNERNVQSANVFLDIHDSVHLGALLGLTFHPNFAKNGLFYIYYLTDNPLRSVIAQWSASSNNTNEVDKTSQKILLEIPQQYDSHGGGQLAFGPDGYLYIALGDGQPYGDLAGNAQNCSKLQGKILRIDVNISSHDREYAIPPDNPFVGNSAGYREEIYAWGFRNPWRFSFDPASGLLLTGDVGQDSMEEIDVVEKGKNYGWNIMEGTLSYNSSKNLNLTDLTPQIWEYGRDEGNATIGGFVYRGSKLPELVGSYIYGDYVSGRIWALNCTDTSLPLNRELLKTNLKITSFGIDEKNELYFCADNGKIYEIAEAPEV